MKASKKVPEFTPEEYKHLIDLALEAERLLINSYAYLNDITGILAKRLYATQNFETKK